jgi:hypothetical protein
MSTQALIYFFSPVLHLFVHYKSFFQNNDGGSSSMCLELALEGERLCKAGETRAGVAFFQV